MEGSNMIRGADVRRTLLALALIGCALPAGAVVLTGEVQAIDAQSIFVPASNSSPVVIRYYLPEGSRVRKGDVLLRIDPGDAASQIPQLDAQIEQARARAAKELAELQVKVVDAQVALVDAQAALDTAKIDAAVPVELISRLDFERHQGELDRAGRELVLKRAELAVARAAVVRRREDGGLEVGKLQMQRDYQATSLQNAEVRADRDGVLIHGFNNSWLTGRIDEGSSAMPGGKAGAVVRGGAMRVQAWALEPDRGPLRVGMPMQLSFDALPGRRIVGRITAIAGAPTQKPEWGSGRYFTVEIALPQRNGLMLLPGMSVRAIAGIPVAAKAAGTVGR
jgi:HlyD family secretion protein